MLWRAGVLQWQPLSPGHGDQMAPIHTLSQHCLHQHSSSLRRNLSISCGAALRCVEIFCWKPLATAAPMSEATITPKIAIQEFSEKQLWQKLWKNALKNDSFWELAYLLIMPLDPVHFSFCFLGAFMLTAKT